MHEERLLLAGGLANTTHSQLQTNSLQNRVHRISRHRAYTQRTVRLNYIFLYHPTQVSQIHFNQFSHYDYSGVTPNTNVKHSYTVPTIYHIATNTFTMDSIAIAKFLESTYTSPPLPLTSELGRKIEAKARAVVGPAFYTSLVPREYNILSPRAQEYFRRTREEALGHPIEDLISGRKEEEAWEAIEGDARAAGELMRTNKAEGPFVLGTQPSFTDFFIAGALENSRVVHERVFERCMQFPGYKEVYEACEPWMEKKD